MTPNNDDDQAQQTSKLCQSTMVPAVWCVLFLVLNYEKAWSQECFGYPSFIITTGQSSESKSLDKFSVTSLKECIHKCDEVGKKCRAVNVNMLEPSGNLECNLLEAIGASGSASSFSFDNSGKLHAERICLPKTSSSCSVPWSFELIPNTELALEKLKKFILKEETLQNKEDCLGECLNMNDCQSVQIDQNRKLCTFLSLTRHAFRKYDHEHFLRTSSQNYVYENNCFGSKDAPKLNQSECKFFTRKNDRIQHMYNLLSSTDNFEQCELSCKAAGPTMCRSFTFDNIKRNCYLSHMTNAVINSPKSRNEFSDDFDGHYIYGELDDCIGLRLDCSLDGMTVYGKTLKLFNGTFGVSSLDNDKNCFAQVTEVLNFSFKVNLHECGTKQEEDKVYTNIFQLKDSFTSLITYRDKLARVVCRLKQNPVEDILVTVQLQVISNTTGEITLFKNDKPTKIQPVYRLKVLNSNLSPVNSVHLGEYGYLEVSFDNVTDAASNFLKMRVSNLTAKDVKNGKELNLFDYDGCPINPELVGNFEYTTKGTLRSKLQFFGFPETAKVYYKGDVRPCLGECPYTNCKSKRLNRLKRDLNKILEDEKYPIKSEYVWHKTVPQLLDEKWNEDWNIKPLKLPKLMNLLKQEGDSRFDYDSAEEYESSVSSKSQSSNTTSSENLVTNCMIKNSTCLITILVIIIQTGLLAVCGCVIYFYCKFFRRRQKNDASYQETFTVLVPNVYSITNDNDSLTSSINCDKLI